MIRRAAFALAAAAVACAGAAFAQGTPPPPPEAPPPAYSRWSWGGGIGLGFGDVSYADISPWVGYRVTEPVTVGGGLLFRWREDERYEPTLSTTDYGASAFTRYGFARNLFLHGEYEYLEYEYLDPFAGTLRTSQSSLFAGLGAWFPAGGNVSFGATVLYDVLHDDSDPFRAYDDPWVVRLGVGVGF